MQSNRRTNSYVNNYENLYSRFNKKRADSIYSHSEKYLFNLGQRTNQNDTFAPD